MTNLRPLRTVFGLDPFGRKHRETVRNATVALLAAAIVTGRANAEPAFLMQPLSPDDTTSVEVIGGTKAKPGVWAATFRFDGPAGRCTATAVGPQTILTAAHCVARNAPGLMKTDRASATVVCEWHDGYEVGSRYYDIALCGATSQIVLPEGAAFETVAIQAAVPPEAADLIILGYGCLTAGGAVQNDVYQSVSKITSKAAGSTPVHETRGSATCQGDSGGGAYFRTSSKKRVIVGVATKSDISREATFGAVSAARTREFLQDWSAGKIQLQGVSNIDARICGIDNLNNCRG